MLILPFISDSTTNTENYQDHPENVPQYHMQSDVQFNF